MAEILASKAISSGAFGTGDLIKNNDNSRSLTASGMTNMVVTFLLKNILWQSKNVVFLHARKIEFENNKN